MRTPTLLLGLLVLAGGCSSSAPSATTGSNAMRTREMSLRVPSSYGTGEVTAAALRLSVIAEAECLTVNPCDARGVRLTFLNRSTRGVRLRFIPVEIVADGATFSVPTADLPPEQEYMPSGRFLTTLLRRDFLPAFATARDVTIRMGQTTVTLTHAERQPVRDLLARMEAPAPSGSTGR